MGVSKGGFGSGVGILATPLVALTVPTPQAAAILLPILLVMDVTGLAAYRGVFSRENLKLILAGGISGVALGAFTFRFFDEALIRVVMGTIALSFVAHRLYGPPRAAPAVRSTPKGLFWSALAGLTSTIAHAGGPPLNIYLLPQQLEKRVFVGTTVIFFAIINAVKVIPYFWLGLFDARNLLTSLALAPLAPVGIFAGLWLVRRIPQKTFYRICYAMLFVVGVKLLHDGVRAWLA